MTTTSLRAPLLALTTALALAALAPASAEDAAARSARVHKEAIVIDTHVDTTSFLMRPGWDFMARHAPGARGAGEAPGNAIDLPRMKDGGLDAVFFSIFIPGTITGADAVTRAMQQIGAVRQLAADHPDQIVLAMSAADARAAHKAGKIAAFMGVEGGHMIAEDLANLRLFAKLGVRYLTLSHSVNTTWADSSGDTPAHNGLTDFGKDVVRELNRLGVMVDISHVADSTFWAALEVSRAPLVASHSSVRALSGHPRNMTDDMIKALAKRGGVIQINYLDQYLDNGLYQETLKRQPQLNALRADLEKKYPGPANAAKRQEEMRTAQAAMPPLPKVSWERIVDHIDHAVKLVGATHVGLGSDFDGATMPVGMEDCTQLPKITTALLAKGYTEQDVKNILGGNILRLLDEVQAVALQTK